MSVVQIIAVLGAGTMGRGIAEVAATHGFTVRVAEIDSEQRDAAEVQIRQSLAKGIARGKLNLADSDEALARVHWFAEIAEAATDADFVIEALPENEDIKSAAFRRLDEVARNGIVLASNTSSISITRLAAVTTRPDRVVGMHFFNPVPIMQPVEIVRGVKTSDATMLETSALAERLGKQPFTVADAPGFVVNRVLMPLVNEAMFALQEGVADAATIDSLMKLGCNHPMGPLELADLIGLDVCLSILRVLHEQTGDPKFRPCPLLVRKVDAGQLGRKSGKGFYPY